MVDSNDADGDNFSDLKVNFRMHRLKVKCGEEIQNKHTDQSMVY